MLKLCSRNALTLLVLACPLALMADVTGTPTLSANTSLSLDTGVTGTSSGDILWNGSSLKVLGSATAIDVTTLLGSSTPSYGSVTSQLISSLTSEFGSLLSTSPISPLASDLLIVHTNGGNYAKVLVTAITGTSITLQFDTFITAPTGPNITGIENNYSNLLAGLPNYGIAPGSLFIIYGTDLASTTNATEAFPLATSLNGTSVSVTVGGTTVQPGLYYIYPKQIAAVLPSTTPVGQGTITVTNGSQTSATFTLQVVQSAFGIDTVYGTGGGQAVITDANYSLIGYGASATPGETVIIWGSGVGADTKNDDKTYPLPNQDNLTGIPMQAYVGGISANIQYRGRSQYPGVDQVVVTIPQNVTPGCNVSIVLLSGANAVASNFTTIAVNPNGGACSDPNIPFNVTSFTGDSSINFGLVEISQSVNVSTGTGLVRSSVRLRTGNPFTAPRQPRVAPTTTNTALGLFERIQGAEFGNYASYQTASVGSCVVYQEAAFTTTTPTTPFTETGLDAGDITVTGPNGSAPLTQVAIEAGFYDANLSSSFISSQGGSFTFNGAGGKDVGSFSVTTSLGSPLFSWTNMASATSVTRAQGVTVDWQGGQTGTYVEISGFSEGNGVGAGFVCLAHQEALQFAVPSWVTGSLPAGQGTLDVFNVSDPVTYTATGLSFGYAYAEVDDSTDTTYN
ncbi:MAG: hypothetical protein JOZ32_21695 [Bryobacterales bacterium]|nr:hypothetical protein [Bryobacterales bacterium]